MVAHADDGPGPGLHIAHRHVGHAGVGATAVTARVFKKVQEDAGEFGLVGHHFQIDGHARGDADLCRVAEERGFAVDQLAHVYPLKLRFARPRVIHELVDDRVELVDVHRHVALGLVVVDAHLGFQPQPGQRGAQVMADAGQHHGAVFLHTRQFTGHAVEAAVDLADLAGQRVFVQP